MLYTEPRYTKDLDIWVEGSAKNAEHGFQGVGRICGALAGIQAETLRNLIWYIS